MESSCSSSISTTELRPWSDLIPDALGLIFRHLSLQDRLTVVPVVCKSWGRVISGPYSWQEIDIEEWSKQCTPARLERMLELLFSFASGTFTRLCVSNLASDSLFSSIVNQAGALKSLELPGSEITDSTVEQIAPKLSRLTFLDLSYCSKISASAIEAFGRNCKSLSGLRRRMYPLAVADKLSQDDEARAIAKSMPRLKHLETAYLVLSTSGVMEILSSCKELEYLDVRGCWEVKLDEKLTKEKHPSVKILGPHIFDDYYERSLCEECSDYSDDSDWELMDEDDVYEDEIEEIWDNGIGEDLQVRFYGGGPNEAFAGFVWPPSP